MPRVNYENKKSIEFTGNKIIKCSKLLILIFICVYSACVIIKSLNILNYFTQCKSRYKIT